MKPEASWWFGKMRGAVLEKNSEKAAEEVKKEAIELVKDGKKFPNNLSGNPPKDWSRKWEEEHQ